MSIALAVSMLCSTVYTATISAGGFPGRWAVKAAAVAALAVLVRRYPVVAAALLLGSLGDALLEISPDYFVHGLVAFLCGHVAYTVAFLRTGARRPPVLLQLVLVLWAAGFAWWLWPGLGEMRVPVLVYMAAITAMAASSLRVGPVVQTGAALFLLSDSLLAANRFSAPVPAAGYGIWVSYYAAQILIAVGYLKHRA